MLGAIVGDIAGSRFEGRRRKPPTGGFDLFGPGCRFTDDTVCNCAVAEWLLEGGELAAILRRWVARHPRRGYGGLFRRWAADPTMGPYGSWGNGAPMRVPPVGWAARNPEEADRLAAASAVPTHDHPEAIRAAQAVAFAIHLGILGRTPAEVRALVGRRYGYDLSRSLEEMRTRHRFDVSAKGTVPPALGAAFEARDFAEAVRNTVGLGGDTDTLGCIAGGVAEAFFGVPEEVEAAARTYLTADVLDVLDRFRARFVLGRGPYAG